MKKQKNSTENNENLSLNDIIVNNKVKANKSDNKVSYKLRKVNRMAKKNRKEKIILLILLLYKVILMDTYQKEKAYNKLLILKSQISSLLMILL